MEVYETELNELRSFLFLLEGFNQKIWDSSDALSEYVTIFHSYIPNLISLSISFYKIFNQSNPTEKDVFGSSSKDKTLEYNQIASQISFLHHHLTLWAMILLPIKYTK